MLEAEEDAAFWSGVSDSAIAEESEAVELPDLFDSPASGFFSSHRIGWMARSLRLRGVPVGGSGGAPAVEGSLSASLAHVARSGHAAGCRGTWSSKSQCSGGGHEVCELVGIEPWVDAWHALRSFRRDNRG
ncbi:hypothetical protein BBM1454_02210 [Bifidobacterium breve MCC 1454]|nr:hypothetical protein BBM1454_02210 [Bifidobacterium breve MCC 1454]